MKSVNFLAEQKCLKSLKNLMQKNYMRKVRKVRNNHALVAKNSQNSQNSQYIFSKNGIETSTCQREGDNGSDY